MDLDLRHRRSAWWGNCPPLASRLLRPVWSGPSRRCPAGASLLWLAQDYGSVPEWAGALSGCEVTPGFCVAPMDNCELRKFPHAAASMLPAPQVGVMCKGLTETACMPLHDYDGSLPCTSDVVDYAAKRVRRKSSVLRTFLAIDFGLAWLTLTGRDAPPGHLVGPGCPAVPPPPGSVFVAGSPGTTSMCSLLKRIRRGPGQCDV